MKHQKHDRALKKVTELKNKARRESDRQRDKVLLRRRSNPLLGTSVTWFGSRVL